MSPSKIFLIIGGVALIVGVLVIYYNMSISGPYMADPNTAAQIAMEFIRNAPTFKWDGVQDSMQLLGVTKIGDTTFEVKIAFTNRHGGYGDRTGKIVTQVITDHEATVVVDNEKVNSAVLDGKWDELRQKPVT